MKITRANYNAPTDVLLFLNGQFPDKMPKAQGFKKIYCTDGAYHKLEKNNIIPDVVCGDLDSLGDQRIALGVMLKETPNQDFTDFHKAVKLIMEEGFKNISVYGCSGLEQDHFLGNISTLIKYKEDLQIRCFDDFGFYFLAEKETIIEGFNNKIISFFPFPKVEKFTSKGVKYSLERKDMEITKLVSTRNTITEESVEITFEEGNLLVFVQHKIKES
jgi:thiamine pyrophosphokinase